MRRLFVGLRGVGRINTVAMGLLFALTVLLSFVVLGGKGSLPAAGSAPGGSAFWFAFEMAAAMPLSWLPLAADYTKDARRPVAASAAAAGVYTLVSTWMYAVGLFAAALPGGQTIAGAMQAAGLCAAGLLVIAFSTVTTTFLDANSAGESAKSLWRRIPAKGFALAVCAAGGAMAALGAMDRYLDFLYFIASVFAPMAAVLLCDAYLRRRRASAAWNFAAWAAGFAAYHLSLGPASFFAASFPKAFAWECPAGATLPALAASAAFALLAPCSARAAD